MIDLATLGSFIALSVLVILAPGPDVIFTITQGLSNGKRAGFTVAMGLACGNLVHTLGVSLGLSVIFQTSVVAFWVIRILGAGYLFYLAYLSFRNRHEHLQTKTQTDEKKENLFKRGFIMNVLNPKVAIFFLAFLPRFVSPEKGLLPVQFMMLGGIFVVLVAIVFGAAGLFAGIFGELLIKKPKFSLVMNIVSAIVFTGIAISLLLY